MNIKIVDSSPHDLPEIERIAERAYSEHRNKVSGQLWKKWIGGVLDSIRSGRGTLIVLKKHGKILGVIQFYDNAAESELDGWPVNMRAGSLRVFAILPEHQSKGYGTMLIKECIRRARELALEKMFLHTGHINEAAIHVFERMGFKRVAGFDFYPYGQKDHIAIAYCLDL